MFVQKQSYKETAQIRVGKPLSEKVLIQMLVKQLPHRQAAKNTVNLSKRKKSVLICYLEMYREDAVQNSVKLSLSKDPCLNACQKQSVQNASQNVCKTSLSKNCIGMLVIRVPEKIVVKNTARTSTAKKNRIEMLL